jgi:hypothetical protein
LKPAKNILIEQPVETFGDWNVFKNGDLTNDVLGYSITADRLKETDWIINLRFAGVDMNTFFWAYLEACQLAGIEQITMKTTF